MARQVLVSCRWLAEALGKSKPRVLEASWVPRGQGLQSYQEEHIASARFFDLWEHVECTRTLARPLPDMRAFSKQLEREGVTDSSELVLYDRGPMFFAARLWLQCKELGLENVSVLDGGLPHWKQQGFPTETGEAPSVPAGSISVRRRQWFMGCEQVSSLLTGRQSDSRAPQVVDVRQPQHFNGHQPEPTPMTVGALKSAGLAAPSEMQAGHMCGSRNLHYGKLIDPDTKCFRPEPELRQLFEEAGIDVQGGPLVSSCYNGIAACMIPLALSKLGINPDAASVYIGSWTEFGQLGSRHQIETSGDQDKPPAAA